MLENAVRICDAKFGNIYRWDGDALHLVATHNTPPAFAEASQALHRFIRDPKTAIRSHGGDESSGSHRRSCSRRRLCRATRSRTRRGRRTWRRTDASGCADAERGRTDRRVHHVPPGSSSVHRQADRAGQELRRPSRHRHRERAVAQRTAPAHRRPQRAHADLTEALEQQTATSEVLQVISQALRAILQPVFRRPCWRMRFAFATRKFGNHVPYEDGDFCAVATHNAPAAFADARQARCQSSRPQNQAHAVDQRPKQVVHIADLGGRRPTSKRDDHVVAAVDDLAAFGQCLPCRCLRTKS